MKRSMIVTVSVLLFSGLYGCVSLADGELRAQLSRCDSGEFVERLRYGKKYSIFLCASALVQENKRKDDVVNLFETECPANSSQIPEMSLRLGRSKEWVVCSYSNAESLKNNLHNSNRVRIYKKDDFPVEFKSIARTTTITMGIQ